MREYAFALLQATDVCKNKLLACTGWKYGPPSARRAEAPPSYIMDGIIGGGGGGINRSDGPEDRILSERCLSSSLPDFGGFRRIVQSRGQVAIFYDVGQGQGWQRIIPITTSPHLPANVRLWWGDSRGRWEGNTLVVDVTNFSPKSNFQGAHENLHLVERWTRTDAETLQYTVTIEDATVWTQTLDSDARPEEARRQSQSDLCRAAVSRRQLRAGDDAGRGARGRARIRRGTRARSGHEVSRRVRRVCRRVRRRGRRREPDQMTSPSKRSLT